MNQEHIGKFIRKCRKERNLTQIELAERLGVSDRSVSNWDVGSVCQTYLYFSLYAKN